MSYICVQMYFSMYAKSFKLWNSFKSSSLFLSFCTKISDFILYVIILGVCLQHYWTLYTMKWSDYFKPKYFFFMLKLVRNNLVVVFFSCMSVCYSSILYKVRSFLEKSLLAFLYEWMSEWKKKCLSFLHLMYCIYVLFLYTFI